MQYRQVIFIVFLLLSMHSFTQVSIHVEEAKRYHDYGVLSNDEYDALSGFEVMDDRVEVNASGLDKIVFGYHPYWGGSNYLNYQWELLSDLCYFSYDVDPETGGATSYYDWLTSPAIDSAFANGTRVHLCVTLFSGQSIFFNNPQSRETLTNNLIALVKQRGAHGVSFDFEAVPSSQGGNMLDYIAEFSTAFHDSLPEGILSIAMPAVDWSGIFDVSVLNQHIDLYMIMGYDYYWNGSSMAGPTDPHYNMTSGYSYSVSRTVSYYQSEGMPMNKMLIGVPYYAREWPTASGTAPSATTGNGSAYTWAKIKNNTSGNYSTENKHLEPNSFGPYYSYNDNGWNQCFVNDVNSLERRYKMVNYRSLAGIGIWALGYDNGYTDLWEVINENLAQGTQITLFDTLYDSGGPTWNYYNDENYTITIHGLDDEAIRLQFTQFNLETGYDSLWVYDGYYPGGYLIGGYTGNTIPPEMESSEIMTLRFRSDPATTAPGWTALVESFLISIEEGREPDIDMKIYPNPASTMLNLELQHLNSPALVRIYDLQGRMMATNNIPPGTGTMQMDVSGLPAGIYLLVLSTGSQQAHRKIIIY
ncbi:MAG: hypothetical protein DRJ15_15855 [Bacteroidetes bacterium]|nr:MAG: hypothetical protein DRJ15_15855 [Bacteroidota bacterium]